jgi:hypothetical protein
MTAVHQGFLEVLNKDQTRELGRKLSKLEGLQVELTLQMALPTHEDREGNEHPAMTEHLAGSKAIEVLNWKCFTL